MATSFKTNKHTSGDIVRQHPVPNRRRAGLVRSLCENPFSGLEAVCLGNANWKPDNVEEEVKHDDTSCQSEDVAVSLGVQVVHSDGNEQEDLGNDPLNRTELYICDIGCEVYAKNGNFGKEEVGCALAVGRKEGSPGGAAPPSNDESKQSTITTSTCFSGPAKDE